MTTGKQPPEPATMRVEGVPVLSANLEEINVDPDNIRSCAYAYQAGAYERVGVYRADAVLGARFLNGGIDGRCGDLRRKLCDHIENARMRLPPEDRNRVIRRVFGDAALERRMVGLSEAIIARDLSRRPCCGALTPSLVPLPEPADLAVRLAIEDLQRRASAEGAGGVGYVAREAVEHGAEAIGILNDPELCADVPGDEVFARIAWLLPNEEDLPTDEEARRIARIGASGRPLLLAIADFDDIPGASAGDLDTIAAFVYPWWFAHESKSRDDDDDDGGDGGDAEAADENRGVRLIRHRRYAS